MRSTVASVKSKERKEAKFPIHHETSKRNLRPQRSLPLVGDIQQAKNSMRALSRDGPPTAHVVPRPSLPFHYGSSNGLNCAFMNSIPAVSTAADAYKAELRFGLAASTPSLCQMQNFYGSSNRLNFELPPPSISYNPVTGANVVHAASVSCLDAQRRVELLESKVGYLESLIPKQADGDLHYGQASTRPPVQHPSVRGTWCRAPFHSEYDRPAHGEDAMLKERQLSTVNSQMRLMNLEKNSLLACMQSLEMKQELERSTYSIHEAEDGKFGNTKGEYLLPQKCFKDIKQCRKMTEQLVKVYKSIADNDQPDLDALLGIDTEIKMDIEIEKYELGKRHLANMMGFDADAITKEDIDHPDELFPRIKSAEFDTDGRPFHFLFYTLNASFYQIMFDCAEKTDALQRYEDAQLRKGKHGIALALCAFVSEETKMKLRLNGLLTWDRRRHERKKVAQPGARKKWTQAQIQEFKEAFNMIDQNRDGFIDKEDLHDMFASLGKDVSDDILDSMINESPGTINFTVFLTLFGEKMTGTDPEEVIRNAFQCFDEEGTGYIKEEYLRELLTTMGDRYTNEQVDELFKDAPIKNNFFNYVEFARMLKHGAVDKDD
ncbi:putative myosin regulatory light chain [Trichinella sp. T8]|nr:putative myosin regulatory light chain [Trichinella sp. T8]